MPFINFDPSFYLDKRERIWWEADKFEAISGDMDFTFEPMVFECESVGFFGDMVCDFATPDFLSQGEVVTVGTINVVAVAPEFIATSSYFDNIGSISVEFVEPQLLIYPGMQVGVVFQPMVFEAWSIIEGDDVEMTFKELSFLGEATSSFSAFAVEFEKPDLEVYSGSYMKLETERMEVALSGSSGIIASIKMSMERMDALMIGGYPSFISLAMKEMGGDLVGNASISSNLAPRMPRARLEMYGAVDIVGSLDLRSISMFTRGWIGGRASDFSSDMELGFWNMGLSLEGSVFNHGSLDLMFDDMGFESDNFLTTNGDVVLELENPEIEMGTEVTPCETVPVVLKFGGC